MSRSQQVAWNKELSSPSITLDRILQLSSSHGRTFNAVNWATCFHRIGKCFAVQVKSHFKSVMDLFMLITEIMTVDDSKLQFECQHLATIIWSMAKTGIVCPPLKEELLAQALQRSEILKPQDLSNIIWSLIKMNDTKRSREFILRFESRILCDEAFLAAFKPMELSSALWAMASSGYTPPKAVLSRIDDCYLSVRPRSDFSQQALANILFSLGKFSFSAGFLEIASRRLSEPEVLATFKPQEINSILCSFFELGFTSRNFQVALSEYLTPAIVATLSLEALLACDGCDDRLIMHALGKRCFSTCQGTEVRALEALARFEDSDVIRGLVSLHCSLALKKGVSWTFASLTTAARLGSDVDLVSINDTVDFSGTLDWLLFPGFLQALAEREGKPSAQLARKALSFSRGKISSNSALAVARASSALGCLTLNIMSDISQVIPEPEIFDLLEISSTIPGPAVDMVILRVSRSHREFSVSDCDRLISLCKGRLATLPTVRCLISRLFSCCFNPIFTDEFFVCRPPVSLASSMLTLVTENIVYSSNPADDELVEQARLLCRILAAHTTACCGQRFPEAVAVYWASAHLLGLESLVTLSVYKFVTSLIQQNSDPCSLPAVWQVRLRSLIGDTWKLKVEISDLSTEDMSSLACKTGEFVDDVLQAAMKMDEVSDMLTLNILCLGQDGMAVVSNWLGTGVTDSRRLSEVMSGCNWFESFIAAERRKQVLANLQK